VPPWDTRSFDDPEVIAAFLNYCERMIATFSPDFFTYAIEANMLATQAPELWPAFVRLAEAVYVRLEANYPDLPTFLTLQADFYHADPVGQSSAIGEILPFTDFIAVSTYPFSTEPDPRLIRSDHFTALAALAPAKPFAISETAWPAEDVTEPYPVFIPADEENQRLYVERLLGEADALSAVFVNWFFTRDFDELWRSSLRFSDQAALVRLWKDTGLYAGDGRPRPALTPWRRWLERPRR
jgi:hypothetical protein